MVISKGENVMADILADNKTLEQVKTFKYFGQIITPEGKNEI